MKKENIYEIKLRTESLDFWYNGKQILFDVNFNIFEKKITALIGPSGCGKSTLLRCFNRMNDIIPVARFKGKILCDGKDIYGKNADVVKLRRNIGMVFQRPNPFPMSIFDNVAYGLKLQNGRSRSEIKRIVKASLEKADLWDEVKDRLSMSAFRLSGGQQQRLCIARALAIDPDVLLLDEPCSALDPIATAKIEGLIKKLGKERTIIIVTHNMQQARRVSDYTCYLLHGKVIEYEPTVEIFESPKDKLTKDYINGVFG